MQFGRKAERPHHTLKDNIKQDLKRKGFNVCSSFIFLRMEITGEMLIRRL